MKGCPICGGPHIQCLRKCEAPGCGIYTSGNSKNGYARCTKHGGTR